MCFDGDVQSKNEPTPATISFGDLRSAPDCHPECVGCSESRSAVSCFACKHLTQSLRNRAGFKCVSHCDEGYFVEGDKCGACSPNCRSCTKAEQCETCPGAKLLVDVDHYAHLDHRQCVDTCPPGLEADYTSAIQARCILKKNICSPGYYESQNSVCTNCDDACTTCHGPGPLQCDSCAPNYSNFSVGYCRPCCTDKQSPMEHHCEDCTLSASQRAQMRHRSGGLGSFYIFVVVLLVLCCAFGVILKTYANGMWNSSSRSNIDYTPLPAQSSLTLNESSSEEESEFEPDDVIATK
ncbi:unnamed protein product [Anisakis simplex]|uniref:Proprotein convertase subtilisin/kexin type 5 n=1 Tax=Anisakis simplex TaxID=6269 RepID=A0A0M3JTD9_ANISI|nr:unnamed protein product [Anisakis simplex]